VESVLTGIVNQLEKFKEYNKLLALAELMNACQLILDKGEYEELVKLSNRVLRAAFDPDEFERDVMKIVPSEKWTPLMKGLLKVIKLEEL